MKLFSILLFILFLSLNLSSQEKQEVHHRARIYYSNVGEQIQLSNLGIEMDHGLQKKNVFIESDFSISELSIVAQSGFEYEIIIEDVGAFYAKQNTTPSISTLNKNLSCDISYNYLKPNNFNLGSMGGFFTYEEIQSQLDLMATLYPDLVKSKTPISNFTTSEGRPLYWLKISDNPNIDENEPEILYDAIHHAREPASVSSLLYYMWYLLENYDDDPTIKSIVDNTELYFVPLVNPDGYYYNQTTNPNGGGLWRKNRRNHGDGNFGVDNNRNYGVQWGTTGISNNTSSNVYPGSGPFSEPENQAMKWFCENHDFKIAFNNHTYSNLLLYPYGYQVNQPTVDDELFQNISAEMVSQNGYINQLAADLYPASGDSDDWMYDATPSKPKILAFTPEIGSSFWPSQSSIIPICQSTMYMNITAAQMVSNFAKITETSTPIIESLNGNIEFDLQRMGLMSGSFNVTLTPISSNITSVSNTVFIPSLDLLDVFSGSIAFTLNSNIMNGEAVSFRLDLDNGEYIQSIDISKSYGSDFLLVEDNLTSGDLWSLSNWSLTQEHFVSSPYSMTDSPNGDYENNASTAISLVDEIDLTNIVDGYISFNAKWNIEDNYDYVQFEISVDGGTTWTPQCGIYTNTANGNQPEGEPLYDGDMNTWIEEQISISDYVGQSIKVRFQLYSDNYITNDGFYFDDFKLHVINQSAGGLNLSLKTLLQGAYDSATGNMRDDLRVNGYIPLQEPYSSFGYTFINGGQETTTTDALSITGSNAIVDWIIVEIRDSSSPTTVLYSRAALLQRDGDVVDIDGISSLQFNNLMADQVVVALRHRNHFGVRTLEGISAQGIRTIDFTNLSLATFGSAPMISIDGRNMMFAADANEDGQVNIIDRSDYWRIENGTPYSYFNHKADFNMDGIVNPVDKNTIWRINNGQKVEQLD